jgi:hypothetical protein
MKQKTFFTFLLRRGAKTPVSIIALAFLAGIPTEAFSQDASAAWSAKANYPNNREPLLKTQYVKLPLGAVKPQGWLHDQLVIAANGLTGHLNEVWDVAKTSAWKGDIGKNVTPEPCWARFVPRWLEGLVPLAYLLDDARLKTNADLYMNYILDAQDLASITPSVQAWSNVGRVLPDYYAATHDERAIRLCRRIIDYNCSVQNSTANSTIDQAEPRLGMLLSFSWWYYNLTGDKDIPDMVEHYTKNNVDYFKDYFINFIDPTARPGYSEKLVQHEHGRQGFDVTQAIQYPVLFYLTSKDESRPLQNTFERIV